MSYSPWVLLTVPCRSRAIETLVDECDLDWISEHGWNFLYKRSCYPDTLYVRRNVGRERRTVYLHREIMMRADPRSARYCAGHVVDHINNNSLDNRRCNLRWATVRQNNRNRPLWVPSLAEIMAANPIPPEYQIPF